MSSKTPVVPIKDLIDGLFESLRVATNEINALKKADKTLLENWNSSISIALQKSYFTAFNNLMDDSGLSDQPFWVEGDSWLLSILTDPHFDLNCQGLILSFIHNIETQLKILTEGGRKIEFLFFKSHGRPFQSSPYLMALRSIAMAYIKHSLCIAVHEFDRPDANLMTFYNRRSPLFTFIHFPVYTDLQLDKLNQLFNFEKSEKISSSAVASKFDLSQFHSKLNSYLLWLVSNNQRAARLNESSSLDGMLQALIFMFQGSADTTEVSCQPILSLELDDLYYPIVQSEPKTTILPFTGITMAKLFNNVSTKLYQDTKIESNRIATLICIFTILFGGKTTITSSQEQFIIITLFHSLFCEKIPLKQRPQPLTSIVKNKDIFSKNENFYPFFTALAQFSSDLFELSIDAISSPCAQSLGDIFDGSLLRSLFSSTHNIIVSEQLKSEEFSSIIQVATHFIKILTPTSSISSLIKTIETQPEDLVVQEEEITAPLCINVPDYFIDNEGKKIISPAAFAAVQWSELPTIDSQILKVLLYSLGDNGGVYNNYKDNQQLIPELSPNFKKGSTNEEKPEEKPEEEIVDDWDAEPVDDWDAESIGGNDGDDVKEDNVNDDWDGEGDENQTAESVKKPLHSSLLGGELNLKTIVKHEESAKYWDTHQLIGDGSTMQAADKESLFIHNPIQLNRDLKNALRTLLYRYSNRQDPKNPYPMPPEEKIKTLCSVSGPMLTPEKAKIWLSITSQNLTMKLENSRITKANSTKKEYNQSMITPSRIVLRDIVATEQIGDIPGLIGDASSSTTTTQDENNNKDGKDGHKKPQVKGGGAAGKKNVGGGPQKESVQEKVARETQEKQQKADMDKVTSIISTCRQPSLLARINELDRKLLAHSDLPSALHGLMTLLDWRVKLWQQQVEKGSSSSATSTSAAASAQLESHMDVAVRLLQLLMDISRRFLHLMSKEQLEKVQSAYAMLGFWDSELEVGMRWSNAIGKTRYTTKQISDALKQASSESKSTSERRYSVGMSRAQFLMQYSGHTLLRNVKSAKDHRVNGFYPDKWQRELLDIVDANESSLVVAPTSAGKTLISFYTVEHVLRQNKEENGKSINSDKRGIVVFVAPTFPLARQMEADISNRNKEATIVIHDNNQKLPHLKFDVLITIPGCLENLMTSPSRIEWVPRIRYIVFDEVHSIGSTLHGPTWERLFLLAHQTPFLALSATVGGVEHFRDWLISMRAKYLQGQTSLAKNAPILSQTALTHATQPSPKVHHISTSVRWSHLHHYFYIPPLAFFTEALEEVQKAQSSSNLTVAAVQPPTVSDGFVPLHPVAALSLNTATSALAVDGTMVHNENNDTKMELNGIDERALKGLFNFEFSSSDAFQTYNVIQLVISKSPRFTAVQSGNNEPTSATNNKENIDKLKEILKLLTELNPDNYFGFFVEKIHILEYEHELKLLLMKLYYAVCDTEIAEIVSTLSNEIQAILAPLSAATRARRQLWKKQFLPLLRSLQQRDWFPAIIFCLDRTLCTELLYEVVEQLEADEHATWVKENDKRLDKKARQREYEAALKAAKKLRDGRGKGSAEAAKELEEEVRMGLVDASVLNPDALKNLKPYNPEDWNADPPDERFSFVKETEWMSEDVRQYWERRVSRKRGTDLLNGQHPLIKALYRGFGVHHYGVDKQYRDLVEILFRQRNLKFVISIETLGLGVNMPCRTAVFAFTTVALNPLNYRQMSGRAGRRGFDDKGQVIFFGIDPYHAGRLMTSSLTPLQGHYNLSCSTVLRLCLKFFFAKETQHALNQVSNTVVIAPDGTKQTIPVQLSQNNVVFDQISFLTRSFFTYSEQFPQHVRIQLLHHFRYCFVYFQYLQLFNNKAPSGLAYLLSAISNTTSSNSSSAGKTPSFVNDAGAFTFIYLLRNGHIDHLCANFDKDQDGTATKVMALLSHLFFPLRLRSGTTRQDYPAGTPLLPGLQPGHVILPSIETAVGPEIEAAMKEHDLFVLKLFSRYALAVASTTHAIANINDDASTKQQSYHTPVTMMTETDFNELEEQSKSVISEAYRLPLSAKTTASNVDNDNPLVQSLTKTSISSSIRTPFTSLSTAKGDTFENPHDLLNSIVKHVDLRASQLPINVDRYSPHPTAFSSYALDFYINGNYDDVILVHGVHKAEAWNALLCFSKLLQVLKKSLSILSATVDEDNDDDFDESQQGGGGDDENDDEEDTFNILRKSQLYQNNQYVKDHLYIASDTVTDHRRVARCFKHVFKTFFHQFTSISREKSKVA